MYRVLLWLAEEPRVGVDEQALDDQWYRAARGLPETWRHFAVSGDGWGLRFAHAPAASWRWDFMDEHHGVVAVSLGLPIGLSTSSLRDLADAALDGRADLADVSPPFGLIVLDEQQGTCVVQQDWLGMCRLFEARAGGLYTLSNRPSLLGGWADLGHDPTGWARFTASGHFGGDSSPIDGVTLMSPGTILRADQCADQSWAITRGQGEDVRRMIEAVDPLPGEQAIDLAAAGLARIASSVATLHPERLALGLSGGRDSRLVASAFIAAGAVPDFKTFEDTEDEGVVARELVRRLERTRNITPTHDVRHRIPAEPPQDGPSLVERTNALIDVFDFQHPTSYLAFPAVPKVAESGGVTLSGAAGELATAYWYSSAAHLDRAPTQAELITQLRARLGDGPPPEFLSDGVVSEHGRHTRQLIEEARNLGLESWLTVDYAYLMERVRRWSNMAYHVGMVAPLLNREFIAAAFSLPLRDRLESDLHTRLISRLTPEWSDVPYVKNHTGRRRVASVTDLSGEVELRRLAERSPGPLTGLLASDAVDRALEGARGGEKVLQQFLVLAVAEDRMYPDRGSSEPAGAAASPVATAVSRAEDLASKLSRRIRRVAARARLPGFTPQWLRHALSSLVPEKVQRWRYDRQN